MKIVDKRREREMECGNNLQIGNKHVVTILSKNIKLKEKLKK